MLRIVARHSRRARDDAAQVALDQRHAGALHRDVGAGAHGDADVGARASAGASLMPSPAMATIAALRLQALRPPRASGPAAPRPRPRRCRAAGDGLGRGAAVAGQHDDRACLPRAAPRIASGVDALTGSATPSRPAARPSTATNITVCAVAAQRRRPRGERRRRRRRAPASSARCRAQRVGRRPCRVTPLPVSESKLRSRATSASAALAARRRRSPPPADARWRARGWRRAAAARPPRSRARLRPRPAAACPRSACRSCRPPACRPSRSSSSASALRISTPACAPRPIADHDRHRRREPERARAGDDQHRDGVDQRVGQARLGAEPAPRATKVSAGDRHHRRHEPAGDRVGEPLDRRAAALRLGRPSATICASSVSAPTRSARMTKLPVPLTVRADHPVAGALLDRHRLAGHHRLVDRAAALEHDAVDRHLLARPHAQPVADLRPASSGTSASLPSARDAAARSSARGRAARGSRALVCAARAQLEHLAEQHQHDDHRRGLEVDRRRAPSWPRNEAGKQARAQAWRRRCSRRRRRCRARSA